MVCAKERHIELVVSILCVTRSTLSLNVLSVEEFLCVPICLLRSFYTLIYLLSMYSLRRVLLHICGLHRTEWIILSKSSISCDAVYSSLSKADLIGHISWWWRCYESRTDIWKCRRIYSTTDERSS